MAISIGKYVVKETTPSDHDQVSELCQNSSSPKAAQTDLLPGRYEKFMKDGESRGYILSDNEKPVSFFLLWADKNNTSVVITDRHTAIPHQEDVLLHWPSIIRELIRTIRSSHPSPQNLLFVDVTVDKGSKEADAIETERTIFTTVMHRYGKSGPKIVGGSVQSNPAASRLYEAIVPAEAFRLTNLLLRPHERSRLFTDQLIYLNNNVYSAEKRVGHVMAKYYDNRYLTTEGKSAIALSLGARIPNLGHKSWLYDMRYHGDCNLDILLAHIYKHVEHAFADPIKITVYFKLVLPSDFSLKYDNDETRKFLGTVFKCHINNIRVQYAQVTSLGSLMEAKSNL